MKKINLLLLSALLCCLVITSCSRNGTQTLEDTSNATSSDETNTTQQEIQEPKETATVKKIIAEYYGKTSAGTKLNNYNGDMTVTAIYDDGSEEEVFDYEVKKPTKLKAGKTSTVLITYGGKKCKLKVKCTTLSKNQYKNKCKAIPYKRLARNPSKYEGKKIKFTGEIVQVMESSYGTSYRINVTKGSFGIWSDTVYVEFEPSSKNRFLEDDIVTFYGTYYGLYTYETVLGASVTIPSVIAKYMTLN